MSSKLRALIGPNFGHFPCVKIVIHTHITYTLWLFNIAMGNGPFIDDFPTKTSIYKGFSMAVLNNQMVYICNVYTLTIVRTNHVPIGHNPWEY